jgi:hypothetical protein
VTIMALAYLTAERVLERSGAAGSRAGA